MIFQLMKWWRDERAVIAVEVGMLIPLMMIILVGTIDVGRGIMTSQKVINAAQTIGDLLGRNDSITSTELNNDIVAGQMAMMPYDIATFGVDVVGIKFVGSTNTPTVNWRFTQNMLENQTVLDKAVGLGVDGEGVLAITVQYTYEPFFSSIFTGSFVMTEVAYVRGRKGLFIPKV